MLGGHGTSVTHLSPITTQKHFHLHTSCNDSNQRALPLSPDRAWDLSSPRLQAAPSIAGGPRERIYLLWTRWSLRPGLPFCCAGCSLHWGTWPQGWVGAEIQPTFYSLSSGPIWGCAYLPKKPYRSAAWVLLRPSKLRLLVGHGWLCKVALLRTEFWSWSPLCVLGPGGSSPGSWSKTVTLSSTLSGPSDVEDGGGRGGDSQHF